VLHLATAVPRPGQPADWALNDRVRREGTANLLAAAAQAGAGRYVQQSITFLYGDQGALLADEATPLQPAPYIASAAEMEQMVAASGLTWSILRGGAFYGPGTGKEAFWCQAAREGTLRLPGAGEGLVSLIHVADMARAVVLAAESAPAGAIYNVVDDRPVTYRELYRYVAALAGGPEPAAGGAPGASLGCRNGQSKAELGWAPAYPTYLSGLGGLLP
jgi:nucleoside-diphosphate-sugar epimerase